MKSPYLPRLDKQKLLWIKNFSSKLNNYASKYGISATEVTDMVQSSAFFDWIMNAKNIVSETSTKFTAYKNEAIQGVKAGAVPSIVPTSPVLPAMPTAVAPDIFGRATSLGGRIKAHKDYSESDGRDLGLEGSDVTAQDLTAVKPFLTVTLNAGKPELVWKKSGMPMIEIWVDRGTGTYVFMTIATNKLVKETYPLPQNGTSQIWKYKAIYRYDDNQVGKWSDEVSVKV